MMKQKPQKKRNELLQKIANFIYTKLQRAKTDKEFEFWMWQGLSLNYWCVERDIYLN
jgi:hypothetical protein